MEDPTPGDGEVALTGIEPVLPCLQHGALPTELQDQEIGGIGGS